MLLRAYTTAYTGALVAVATWVILGSQAGGIGSETRNELIEFAGFDPIFFLHHSNVCTPLLTLDGVG
jgi:hypothetical protein